jgi:hypothetical protein
VVTTHLVQFKFYHGATVNEAAVPVTFAGHTTFPPFYAFKGFSVGEPVPEPEPEPAVEQEAAFFPDVHVYTGLDLKRRKRKDMIRRGLLLG